MHGRPGAFSHRLTSGPVCQLLRLVGLLVPPLFVLSNPWPLDGVGILVAFGIMATVSGALLRTWWAPVIVPALVVATVVGHTLLASESRTAGESELSTAAAVVLGIGLLAWTALAAFSGTWVSQYFTANDRDG